MVTTTTTNEAMQIQIYVAKETEEIYKSNIIRTMERNSHCT